MIDGPGPHKETHIKNQPINAPRTRYRNHYRDFGAGPLPTPRQNGSGPLTAKQGRNQNSVRPAHE